MCFDGEDFGLLMQMILVCDNMTAGDGAQRSILRLLDSLTVDTTELWNPNWSSVVYYVAAANYFIGGQ